jgi:hypothetical protein
MDPATLTSVSSSKRTLLFGSSNHGSCPVSFNQLQLSDSLLQYIQLDNIFTTPNDQESLEAVGFEKCVDYPEIPGHTYFEGYFHSLPQQEAISGQHPRFGIMHSKPRAPPRLSAFCEAVRRKNHVWISALQRRLEEIPSAASRAMTRVVADNRLFAGKRLINLHEQYLQIRYI